MKIIEPSVELINAPSYETLMATIEAAGRTCYKSESKISEAVLSLVDLRPAAIIRDFDLRKPIYCDLAAYGHMGREDLGVKWEERDLAEKLKKALL